MPKIKETREAYYIEPTLAESLGSVFASIAEVLGKKNAANEKKAREADRMKEEAAKLKADIAKIAEQDPETANQLERNPAVQAILDPTRAEKMKHEGEGFLTRLRHKGQHENLKQQPGYKPDTYAVTPQLRDQ